MNKRSFFLLISIGTPILSFLFTGCPEPGPPLLRIALSRGTPDTSYANYYHWIKSLDSTAECVDMYAISIDSALDMFRRCSGLLLTGGTDINPAFYDKAFDTVRCLPLDSHRDQLEMRLIDSALAWGKPILGICRGHQMINVALGGSMVVDIPQDRGTVVMHQCEDYLTCFHPVHLVQNTMLAALTGVQIGEVNTNHHQAIDILARDLMIAAHTSDGIPEAVEWSDPAGKPFMLGIQWHPERMDLSNPLCGAIGRRFMEECRETRQ